MSRATNDCLKGLPAEPEEIVDAARRRVIGELSLINVEDANSAPFTDLRRSTATPPPAPVTSNVSPKRAARIRQRRAKAAK